MTEEVESFGGSRWEVQDIKVLAGWPAKPQTPCRLWSPGFTTLPPTPTQKGPWQFQRPPQRSHLWTRVGKVNCTSSRELGICVDLQARGTISPWPLTASRKQHIHSRNIYFKQTELRYDYSFTVSRISSLWLRSTHSSNPPAPSLISLLAKPICMRPAASQLNNVNRITGLNFQTIYYGCISLHSPYPLSLTGKPRLPYPATKLTLPQQTERESPFEAF